MKLWAVPWIPSEKFGRELSLKIVIIGAGEVGFNLARELSQEDFDITIVDILPQKVRRASESLDVNTLEGNGASPNILRQAQTESADIFLALTRSDEVNLVSCQMAKALGARKIIARLRNTEYTSKKSAMKPKDFGIDEAIHPELVVVDEVERLLRQSAAIDVKEFEGGRVQLVGVFIQESSPILDQKVADLSSEHANIQHKIIAINRRGKTLVPDSNTVFQPEDAVYVLGETRHIPDILGMMGKKRRDVKKIMILGAGKIGRRLAGRMQDELDVKLVDSNKAKAWEIAPNLPNVLMLHGDGTDIDFLLSENIDEMDSFIAVTQDEQTNLLTGLLAKHLGAKHVVVHLSTTSYLPIARRIGIDTAISKNLVTVEAIMRAIRSTPDRDISRFEDLGMESVELMAEEGSPITGKVLKETSLPKGIILAAVMRGASIEIPTGETQLAAGDRALVFVLSEQLEKVEKLFS